MTAIWHEHRWNVLEFNIRLGVTSGPLILRMMKQPIQALEQVVNNRDVTLELAGDRRFGCSVTLAGYGYPYTQLTPPRLSVEVTAPFDCDVWWNEVDRDLKGHIATSGQGANRIADVTALGHSIDEALEIAYRNIKKMKCPGSYYRTDVGQTMWPPIYE